MKATGNTTSGHACGKDMGKELSVEPLETRLLLSAGDELVSVLARPDLFEDGYAPHEAFTAYVDVGHGAGLDLSPLGTTAPPTDHLIIGFDGDTSAFFPDEPMGHAAVTPEVLAAGTSDYMLIDHHGGNWSDAEKWNGNTEDDDLCWAAAASNVLEWTGWGAVDGMTNTDQMFRYFQDHWTDEGGLMEYGWDWWFDGTNNSPGGTNWAQVDVAGGGFYPSETFSNYFRSDSTDANALPTIDQYLRAGHGTTIGIQGPGGHAITVWGIRFDTNNTTDYKGLYVTDSDSHKHIQNAADDMQYYDIAYTGGKWFLQNYYGSNAWYIDVVQALLKNPDYTPPSGDAYEDNDTKAITDARPEGAASSPNLGLLTTVRTISNLSVDDGADWYRFRTNGTGTAADFVKIDFSHSQGDLDMTVYKADGATEVGTSQSMTDGEQMSLNGQAAGTYYVKVYGYNGAQNPQYTLTIDPPAAGPPGPAGDAYENNDTKAITDARPEGAANSPNLGLVTGVRLISNLSMDDGADWYRFRTGITGTAGDFVRIDFSHSQGDLDMVVYEADGVTQVGLSQSTTDREEVSLNGLAAGTYYVKAYGYHGAQNPLYSLTIDAPADQDVPVGDGPRSIVYADFNQDALQDLAVVNTLDNDVSVFYGQAGGGFGGRVDYAVGATPRDIVAADFNADGRVDLAVANFADNDVSVLWGLPGGAFGSRQDYGVGAGPVAIVSGDFNNDGRTDLATANYSADTVTVLHKHAVGGYFGSRQDIAVGHHPADVVAGDFNNDYRTDLAVANFSDGDVSVLWGLASGGIGSRQDYGVGAGATAIVAGDFNGDSRLDLATANYLDNSVTVLHKKAVGGYFGNREDAVVGSRPAGLTAAYFNADTRLDLAATNFDDNDVSVLYGQAAGGLGGRRDSATGAKPIGIVTADLNADGWLDLAVCSYANDNIRLIHGEGGGTFGNVQTAGAGNARPAANRGDAGPARRDAAMAAAHAMTANQSAKNTFRAARIGNVTEINGRLRGGISLRGTSAPERPGLDTGRTPDHIQQALLRVGSIRPVSQTSS